MLAWMSQCLYCFDLSEYNTNSYQGFGTWWHDETSRETRTTSCDRGLWTNISFIWLGSLKILFEPLQALREDENFFSQNYFAVKSYKKQFSHLFVRTKAPTLENGIPMDNVIIAQSCIERHHPLFTHNTSMSRSATTTQNSHNSQDLFAPAKQSIPAQKGKKSKLA